MNVPEDAGDQKNHPALAAGCTVVFKPPPETALDAFVLADAAQAAGIPAGVFNVVPGVRDAGDPTVRPTGVDKVAVTGPNRSGRANGAKIRRVSCWDRECTSGRIWGGALH